MKFVGLHWLFIDDSAILCLMCCCWNLMLEASRNTKEISTSVQKVPETTTSNKEVQGNSIQKPAGINSKHRKASWN